jgi:hypothetical protein
MEKFPAVEGKQRFPLHIPIYPCFLDHRFQGKAVLPAVEAMQVLAASVSEHLPAVDPTRIEDARFDKFLFLDSGEDAIAAFNEIEALADGRVLSTLLTRKQAGTSGITRTKIHVSLCFSAKETPPPDPLPGAGRGSRFSLGGAENVDLPTDQEPASPLPSQGRGAGGVRLALMGERFPYEMDSESEFRIPADRLYGELVPFGPVYHNIRDAVVIFEEGALADVAAAPHRTPTGPLGSPFPLDAAFHMACAWGQRYAGVVAFPVGLEERRVLRPTIPGEVYRAVVRPVRRDPDMLVFDMALIDADGAMRESARGVRMRDVSGGRLTPPDWVVRR